MPLTLQEISHILKNGENQITEFKTSFQKEVIESVVSFANTYGGKIFVGVSDNGDVLGVNSIKQNTQPSIIVDIKKHLMTEFIITGEAQRTIKYDYPLEAIREIVINMIVHRDYRDSGNSIIKIFDNKIEFFNPGKLYDDLTIEKLDSGEYSSKTRNRAIARAFKEVGNIERYGSGIQRIKKECTNHGKKEVRFEEFSHGFKVTLYKERINDPLNKLTKLLKKDKTLSYDELALKLNKSKATIKRNIQKLKSKGSIQRVGSDKTGYWEVIENEKEFS